MGAVTSSPLSLPSFGLRDSWLHFLWALGLGAGADGYFISRESKGEEKRVETEQSHSDCPTDRDR